MLMDYILLLFWNMNVEEEQQREYYKYFFLHIAYVYQEIN